MTNALPLVSIVTPYRDAQQFLPGLVATLQAQTYSYWECLLVDHASSDGGSELAKALTAKDLRFRHLRLEAEAGDGVRRPAIPRNAALEQVQGSLVCFLDVDDLWHPEKLERQLHFHLQNRLAVSVTAYGRTVTNNPIWLTWRCPPRTISLPCLRRRNVIPMLTVMLDAGLLTGESADGRRRFKAVHHEDYVFWLQLWAEYPELPYGCLPELLALHQRHGQNTTSNRLAMLAWLYEVHAMSANIPAAIRRTLVGISLQCALNIKEACGHKRLPYKPHMAMGKKPLRIRID